MCQLIRSIHVFFCSLYPCFSTLALASIWLTKYVNDQLDYAWSNNLWVISRSWKLIACQLLSNTNLHKGSIIFCRIIDVGRNSSELSTLPFKITLYINKIMCILTVYSIICLEQIQSDKLKSVKVNIVHSDESTIKKIIKLLSLSMRTPRTYLSITCTQFSKTHSLCKTE